MKTLSELIKEKNKLPQGNIYIKRINGKSYYYYQYFENGKRYSQHLREDAAADLCEFIERRKKIEKQIKEIKQTSRNYTISNSALNLSGQVMSGNIVVASFNEGELIYINEQLAPLIIKRTHSLKSFLELRLIDMSRTNARILKKALNIRVDEEYKSPLFSYALSVSDDYWFKPKHSKLKYSDLIFNNDVFCDLSLKGDITVFPASNRLTPEITTTGSFEKGWKIINKKWWLYKTGNKEQLFSELFCYEFALLMELDTAIYEYDNGYIRSKNFADKYNFEPIASLSGDDDSYEYVFSIIYDINKKIAKDYIKLIFFDSVVTNVDRHNENLGLLRERGTGKIIKLAPNFDNNVALISSSSNMNADPKKDGFVSYFVKFIKNNKNAYDLFKQIDFIDISKEDIKKCIDKVPIEVDNSEQIIEAVYNRYYYLKNL